MEVKLKEGNKAPVFEGYDQNGNKVSLKDYLGKKVVLYFYPKDNTPGCTAQACNLRDNYQLLINKGFQIIGISIDTVKKHKNFEEKYGLPFTLVADPDQVIVKQYGVWSNKFFMGRTFLGTHRTTFLIDEKGIIKKIIDKPNTKSHTEQVLEAWDEK